VRGRSRLPWFGWTGLILVLLVAGVAVIGPFALPHSPTALVGSTFRPPSARFPLGTDVLGRDTLSRVLAGGYTILGLSLAATAIGVISGALLGVWAGYTRGAVDEVIMRAADVVMAFPQTILVLLFVSIIGAKLWLLTLMVGVIHAPQVARVARAAALRIAGEDFILYAESLGTARSRIIAREIVPNITSILMVEFGLRLAYSVTLIAGLSFLGFGVQPPAADWGLMINENRIGLARCPWPVLVPVLLIALLTIGMNLLTDAAARAVLGGRRRRRTADTAGADAPNLAKPQLLPAESAR
jgi:peptide/nickel transport system permease protein